MTADASWFWWRAAGAGDAARADLALVGHHATKGREALVVDLFDLLLAEGAVAAAGLAEPSGLTLLLTPRLGLGAGHACSLSLQRPGRRVLTCSERDVVVAFGEVAGGRAVEALVVEGRAGVLALGSGLLVAAAAVPPSRGPMNWTRSAAMLTASRFCPSCVSHWRQRRRPETATWRPRLRYWAQVSA